MNPALFILLAGAVAFVAISAGSSSGESSSFVEDAESMTEIFQFYTTKMGELSNDELTRLGKLNAAAKGLKYYSVDEWISLGNNYTTAWNQYKRNYFLPPGVSDTTGPDMFSEWASNDVVSTINWFTPSTEPNFTCTEYFVGGLGSSESGPCSKGIYTDWFGRQVGTYKGDGTVHGQSDLTFIGRGLLKEFKDLWKASSHDFLQYVASVASNYPGIGTVVAAGVVFLEELGSGASLENAAVAAGRAAVPSALRSAYDVGVGLATTGDLDVEKALGVAMAAAISQGVINGDVLERYNQIKDGYEQAKAAKLEVQSDLKTLNKVVNEAKKLG